MKGLRALGVRQPKRIIVVASPIRSRGCAEVGEVRVSNKGLGAPRSGHQTREGEAIVISIASPSHFSLRRLAKLFEHEVGHTHGLEHEEMQHDMLWSLGPTPRWAEGAVIRYRRRAPSQM